MRFDPQIVCVDKLKTKNQEDDFKNIFSKSREHLEIIQIEIFFVAFIYFLDFISSNVKRFDLMAFI